MLNVGRSNSVRSMGICSKCGGQLEFRYISGRATPIHVSGGGCGGANSGISWRPFADDASYVNPNANCPVCGEVVFFYKSPTGGRVFFDALGWPWQKHPCTDNPTAQTTSITMLRQTSTKQLKNSAGDVLSVYKLVYLREQAGILHMQFRKNSSGASFKASICMTSLGAIDVSVDEMKEAPSFVVGTFASYRTIEFISSKKRAIVGFKINRPVQR